MLLTIAGQNVRVPEHVKAYATTKVSRLPKYYDNLDRVRVTLRREPAGVATARIVAQGKRKHCFVAEETADNAYGSISRAARDIERQLSRVKKRVRNRKHCRKAAVPWKE